MNNNSPIFPRPQPLLAFLHIPKAGGTTLRRLLYSIYGENSICPMPQLQPDRNAEEGVKIEKRRRELEERLKTGSIRVCTGHFNMAMASLLPPDTRYFTMVREPVSRVVSAYHYMKRKEAHPLHRRLNDENISLEQFVSGDYTNEVTNDQTWRIAGITWEEFDARPHDNPPEILSRALANIERYFDMAAIMEDYDSSLLLLKRIYRWPWPYYRKRNTAGKKKGAGTPESVKAVIRERNQLDGELHRILRERLQKRVAEGGEAFAAELRRFQFWNRVRGIMWNVQARCEAGFLPGRAKGTAQ